MKLSVYMVRKFWIFLRGCGQYKCLQSHEEIS